MLWPYGLPTLPSYASVCPTLLAGVEAPKEVYGLPSAEVHPPGHELPSPMYTMLLRLLSPELQTLLRSLQLPVDDPEPDEDAGVDDAGVDDADVEDFAGADDEGVPPATASSSFGEAAGVDDGVDAGGAAAAEDLALSDPGAQPPFAHT